MLKRELPVLVNEWGSESGVACSLNAEVNDVYADAAVTSCKLFMTYTAMQLRDNELLDVMYEARKLAVTTVRGLASVSMTSNAADAGISHPDDPRGERRPHSLANRRVWSSEIDPPRAHSHCRETRGEGPDRAPISRRVQTANRRDGSYPPSNRPPHPLRARRFGGTSHPLGVLSLQIPPPTRTRH
jgi:hypothetical protein